MKLPIRTLGLMAAALLIGSALSTAVAQGQQSGADGQVALRSDGALYLIINGQRRWIATVPLADSDINAIPEGDPIMVGLAPLGSAEAAAQPKPAASPAASTTQASGGTTAAAKPASTPSTPAASTANVSVGEAGEELSTDIPIEVDLDGSTRIDQGDERRVDVKTKAGFTCELKLILPGGESLSEDSKNADSTGKCKFNIQIPDDAKDGDGKLVGTAREGGKLNRQEIPVQIGKKKN
jgi:hypothetical protein